MQTPTEKNPQGWDLDEDGFPMVPSLKDNPWKLVESETSSWGDLQGSEQGSGGVEGGDREPASLREMLTSLYYQQNDWLAAKGNEIAGGGNALLASVYGVVEKIGTSELRGISGAVDVLLAQLGPGTPRIQDSQNVRTDGRLAAAIVRGENDKDRVVRNDELLFDLDALYSRQTPVVMEKLHNRGINMRNDVATLLFMVRTIAHESAHLLQGQVGRRAGYAVPVDYMSGLVAQQKNGDPSVLNEQFAEGYAEIVLTEVLRTLEYSESDIKGIMSAMSHDGNEIATGAGYVAMGRDQVVEMLELAGRDIATRSRWSH